MPVIREYNAQVDPSGLMPTRRAGIDDFGGGGAGLAAVGDAITHYDQMEEQRKSDTEVTDLYAKMAQARLDWTKTAMEREKTAQPGDTTYADGMQTDLNKYFGDMRGNYKTKAAQKAFARMSAELTDSIVGHALNFQNQLAGQQAKMDAENMAQNNAQTVAMDPKQYDAVKAHDEQAIMGGEGNYRHLNTVQREALVKANMEHYAWAAAYSSVEQDPMGALSKMAPNAAANKMNGVPIGGAPGGAPRGMADTFTSAVNAVLAKEGGYNAKDGHSGNPVNFGINQGANPDIDVKNLTKSQAVEIYRKRYWEPIGGDKLDPATAIFAMDTAVNMGVPAANKLIASGGTIEQMAAQRKQMYQAIVDANPAQAKYLKGWLARTDTVAGEANQAATATAPLAVQAQRDPSVIANDAPIPGWKDLSVDKQIALINHAETRQNQIMAVNRAQLEQTVKDQTTQALTVGYVGAPLSQDQFVNAYGPAEGVRKYNDEYKPMIALGQEVSKVAPMPVAQQNAYLASIKPVPNTTGFASAQARYEIAVNAVNNARAAREKDPIQFGIDNKIGGLKPLDMTTPQGMADGVVARIPDAQAVQSNFGMPSLKLLTKPEADTMNHALKQMDTSSKIAYLDNLQAKIKDPNVFRAVIQQITPDSPVTATAARLLGETRGPTSVSHWFKPDETFKPKEVAGIILEGEALLNKSKGDKQTDGSSRGFPMPQEALLRQAFNNEVGNAFAGMPQQADVAYQAARAYYAGKSARTGNLSSKDEPNTDLIQEAVKAVTGGKYSQNGTDVLVPYGMPQDTFRTAVKARFDTAMAAQGYKGTPLDNFDLYGLRPAGDGQYYVQHGADLLQGRDGRPVILNVKDAPTPSPYITHMDVAVGQRERAGRIHK